MTAPRNDLEEHRAVAAAMDDLMPLVSDVIRRLCDAFANGGRVYTFGNGGSAADAQHLAAELIGHFRRDRRALPVQALSTDPSVMTAIANDYAYDEVFARQVEGLAGPGDVCVAFTTSGESVNVVRGLEAARRMGATAVALTGGTGGRAAAVADHAIVVPSGETARIQELHLLITHLVSELVDEWAAAEEERATAGAGGRTA